jgi:serine protease
MRPVTHIGPRPRDRAAAIITGLLINHGGPVEAAPRVYVVFWGWTSDPSGEQTYLTNFLRSVGGTSWLYTVFQYGGGWTGDLPAGTWSDSASIPASPTDAQIQSEAAKAASHFGAGTSANAEIVVATPHGHSSSGFGLSYCAYHGAISADPNVTYTNLPYMTDAGVNCGEDSVNGSNGLLDGVSIVEGHELAETITDPLLSAWYDAGGNEIGDKCAWTGLRDIIVSGKSFAVQPLWNNAFNECAPVNGPLGLANPGTQSDLQFDDVRLQMIAIGGTTPFTWSAPSLPPGATINTSTGMISGLLKTTGQWTATVKVTDAAGHTASVTFAWSVTNNCPKC